MSQEKTIICRALTFPCRPRDAKKRPQLDRLMMRAWGLSTHLANWTMSELYLVDVLTLDRTAEKLAPLPAVYLYGLFVRSYPRYREWDGAMAQANTILKTVEKKYKEKRLDIVWRCRCSLPTYRYPYPFPVHNQNWKPFYGPDNEPLVQASLPGGKQILQLRGGMEMHRQLRRFSQLVEGAKRGEMALYRKGKHLMAKLVGWFEVEAQTSPEKERVLIVRSDPNALWVAEIEGIHARVWNQDHIHADVDRHRVWRQRLSEDMKREKRVSPKMRRHMREALEKRCRKMNDKLDTFCHEMTKQLAQFAERQKITKVIYSDACKEWLSPFPWHDLKTKLRYKLEERAITFVASKDDSASDDAV